MTNDQLLRCSEFLGELVALGARMESLGTLEEAYWNLLINPESSPWDIESPFRNGGHAMDLEKCCQALAAADIPAEIAPEVSEALMRICQKLSGAIWSEGIEEGLRARTQSHSLGALVRCATFIAIARRCGCYPTRQSELDKIVVEEAGE